MYKVKYILYDAKQRLFGRRGMGELWVTAKSYSFALRKASVSWGLEKEGFGTSTEGCEGKILVTKGGWL